MLAAGQLDVTVIRRASDGPLIFAMFQPLFDRRGASSNFRQPVYSTYDHRFERTGHPIRSGILKLEIG